MKHGTVKYNNNNYYIIGYYIYKFFDVMYICIILGKIEIIKCISLMGIVLYYD